MKSAIPESAIPSSPLQVTWCLLLEYIELWDDRDYGLWQNISMQSMMHQVDG